MHDMHYILSLMENVIDQIDKPNVMQVVKDNGS